MDTAQRIDQIIEEKTELPIEIRRQINLLNSDLYDGPLYFDKDGEPCCHMDPGAEQWNFSAVAHEVMNYLRDEVPSEVYVDMDTEEIFDREPEGWEDEETGEWMEPHLDETYRVDDVYRTLLGRELHSTIARY